MSPQEFINILKEKAPEEIVEELFIENRNAKHVPSEAIDFIESTLKRIFQIPDGSPLTAYVVGSAKLGFSIIEKVNNDGIIIKPAYRDYDPRSSDIDIAIVNPNLYGKLWSDLSRYGYKKNFPWRGEKLADYMLHGWIRPDKFPTPLPLQCNVWDQAFRTLSLSDFFRFKKLRCGIYHSKFFLKSYQIRSIEHAKYREQNADI